MNAWPDPIKAGVEQATGFLVVALVVLAVRTGGSWCRRRVRRWLGHPVEPGREPGPAPRWADHLMALIFAAWPLGLGMYRLIRGRFYAWHTWSRSHPHPPLYYYEGGPAAIYALALLVWGGAIYVTVVNWSRPRWRAASILVGILGLYAGFILYHVARAQGVKVE